MVDDVRGEPEDIDAIWMTEALQAAGDRPRCPVTDVSIEAFVGTGQTGATLGCD